MCHVRVKFIGLAIFWSYLTDIKSKSHFLPHTQFCRVHKHVPEAEEGQAQEETQGAPDLGHEGGEGVDILLLLDSHARAGEPELYSSHTRAVRHVQGFLNMDANSNIGHSLLVQPLF